MDKAPGIYSARFLGEDTSYRIKNQYIIDKLAGVPDPERTARFVCAIAAVFPDGSEYTERGDHPEGNHRLRGARRERFRV